MIVITKKKYYSERKGMLQDTPIDFEMLKKIFLMSYEELEKEIYFQEAIGYTCVDAGRIEGKWGNDFEAFIYTKIKMRNIWSIQDNIASYDEPTFFTIVEFLYDYVSEPIDEYKRYHSWNNCGWHCTKFDKEKGQEKYRNKMNEILKDYDEGYHLTNDGEIQKIPSSGYEDLIEEPIETDDPENIDNRIKNAISKYFRYGSTFDDKKEAIRILSDVMEYLKKDGIVLPSKDDSDLFQIINRFDIRHHNKQQISNYDKELWYDWMFYTFLASIKVLVKIKDQ